MTNRFAKFAPQTNRFAQFAPATLGGIAPEAAPAVRPEPVVARPAPAPVVERRSGLGATTGYLGSAAALDEPALREMQRPDPVPPPVEEQSDQFSGENLGSLLTRRGQQVTQGVTGGLAAALRGAAAGRASFEDLNREGAERFLAPGSTMPAPVPTQEQPAWKAAERIEAANERTFGLPPEDDSIWAKTAQGFGSFATFIAATALAQRTGVPLGGFAAGAGLGGVMNRGAIYKEAIDAGASEEDAQAASKVAEIVGMAEVLPVLDILKPLEATFPGIQSRVLAGLGKVLRDAAEEAAQEGFLNQIPNNLIAKGYYDPDRGWSEGLTESMIVGAILGGGASGVVSLATGGDRDREEKASVPLPPAKARDLEQDQALYEEAERIGREIEAAQERGEPLERVRELQADMQEVIREREAIASPISTDLIRQGEEVMRAAEEGRPIPVPAASVQQAAPVDVPPEDAAILFGAGYNAEQIADMTPAERATEIAQAREEGVAPVAPDEAARRLAEIAVAPEGAGAVSSPAPSAPVAAGNTSATDERGAAVLSPAAAPRPAPEAAPTASWVIRNKETGEVVMETFDRAKVDALNTTKYEAVPIGDYLGSINTPEKRAAAAPQPASAPVAAPAVAPTVEARAAPARPETVTERVPTPSDGKAYRDYINSGRAQEEGRRATQTETITPANDTMVGTNAAGETLYERTDGSRYRMRTDRPADRPYGYPDFGGDLAPVTAQDRAESVRRDEPEVVAVAPEPPAIPTAPSPRRAKAPLKRPFTHRIKAIGIHPQGKVAEELRASDITPRTAPGLFRKSGPKNLDNLPASEWADVADQIGQDGNGYLSEQGIIDAIRREFAGEAVRNTEQQAAAEAQDEAEARDRAEAQADAMIADLGVTLTSAEREEVIEAAMAGDNLETVIERIAEREIDVAEDAAGYDEASIPGWDEAPVASQPGGSRDRGPEGRDQGEDARAPREEAPERAGPAGAAEPLSIQDQLDALKDDFGAVRITRADYLARRAELLAEQEKEARAAKPTEEPGADNLPQQVIPGAERSEGQARAATSDRAKAEIAARQQQSKMRRLDQTRVEDVDGLFGEKPKTLFSRRGSAEYAVKPPKRLYRGRVEGEQADGSSGLGTAHLGRGLYSSPDKDFAAMYGPVSEVSVERGWPRNPLVLRGTNSAESLFLDYVFRNTDFKNAREFNKAFPDRADFVRSLGFDGVIAGDEVVRYPEMPGAMFSRRTAVIPEAPLYVVHNLSAEKLRHVVDLGGMAAPSLAIARGDIGMDNFGEISLIGPREMADPRAPGMKTFNADVYSPRQPRAQFDLNRAGLKKMESVLGDAARDMGTEISSEFYDDKISREGLDAIASSKVAQLAYLREIGDAPKPVMRDKPKLPVPLRGIKGNRYWDILNQPDFPEKALAAEKETLAALPEDLRDKIYDRHIVVEDGVEALRQRQLDDAARLVAKANSPAEVDVYATESLIRKRMDKRGRMDAYRAWVEDNFADALGAKFFRTESGRRKPYEMDAIVREMTRTLRDGEGFNYGAGSVRSVVARPFKSVTAIKDARRSIVTDKEMEAIKDEANNELFALADKFAPYHASGKDFGWGDIFSEFLKDLANGKLRDWQTGSGRVPPIFNSPAPPELIAEARAFLDKLRDLPTNYFEIKAQRAVALNEFVAALVPRNAPKDAVDTLKAAGLEVVRYDQKSETGRRDALQKVLPRVAFARRLANQPPFYSAVLRATEGIQQDKGNGLQWLAMLRKQPGVKEEELNWLGLPTWLADRKGITKADVLDYIRANQVQVQEVTLGGKPLRWDDVAPSDTASAPFMDEWNRLSQEISAAQEIMRETRWAREPDARDRYNRALGEAESLEAQRDKLHQDMVAATIEEMGGLGKEPKYASYTLPGGQNYRELLITMPNDGTNATVIRRISNIPDKVLNEINSEGDVALARKHNPYFAGSAEGLTDAAVFKAIEAKRAGKAGTPDYRTPHWDEPNILAHIRFNEREIDVPLTVEQEAVQARRAELMPEYKRLEREIQAAAKANTKTATQLYDERDAAIRERFRAGELSAGEGRRMMEEPLSINDRVRANIDDATITRLRAEQDALKMPPEPRRRKERVLFIEEIQSDWHQAGRKKGYAGKVSTEGWRANQDSLGFWNVMTADGTDVGNFTASTAEGAIQMAASVPANNAVPDAPLKSTWHETAFRRAVAWAAENGFDRVAWTPGEMQAERFDLSKRIKEIEYTEQADAYAGTYLLEITDFDGDPVRLPNGGLFKADELPDVVGKDVADRIIAGGSEGVLSGLDLKVGGEGMAGFYDRILPTYAKKWGKKFGAEVGTVKVPAGADTTSGDAFVVSFSDGTSSERFDTRAEAEAFLRENPDGEMTAPGKQMNVRSAEVWSMPITDAMRETVQAEGVPLFQQREEGIREAAPAIATDLRARLDGYGMQNIKLRLEETIAGQTEDGTQFSADGYYLNGMIAVALDADTAGRGAVFTLDHETIHALRDPRLWGRPYGLFNEGEWRTLERAAAGDALAQAKRDYPDLTPAQQIEEAIANMFADWQAGRTQHKGFIRTAFDKVRNFLTALGEAFRGNGFRTAYDVFGSVADGRLGQRSYSVGQTLGTGAGFAEARMSGPKTFILAYHGSPHDFDRFDLSKIGTGEGAQAYGHGLYFAEKEDVAKAYRDALTPVVDAEFDGIKAQNLPWLADNTPEELALRAVQSEKDISGARNVLERLSTRDPDYAKALEWFDANESRISVNHPGHMYEVNIRANPDDFLDWDQPLAGQPPHIQQRIREIAPNAPGMASGHRLLSEVAPSNATPFTSAADRAQAAATERLREAGIPGIRYLDQGSRTAGDGSRNYVVFDDSLIEIRRKYTRRPDITKTEAFRKWFGRSAVVDADGEPLVVYHGTNADIGAFDAKATADGGFHFGTAAQANMRGAGAGKNLMPAYVAISNPQRSKDMGGKWKSKIAAAKSAGRDGIVYLNRYEGLSSDVIERLAESGDLDRLDRLSDAEFRRLVPEAQDSWIAFRPEQIKSAFNRGTFDAGDPRILFSRRTEFSQDAIDRIAAANAATGYTPPAANPARPSSFATPKRTRWRKVVEALDDRFDVLQRAQRAIEAVRGAPLPESIDAYLAQSLYDTRTAAKLEKFMAEEVAEITKAMRDNDVPMDDLGIYLIAKHAPERNAIMAQRDPARFGQDGGSGLTNQAAADLLAQYTPDQTAKLDAVARLVWRMTKRDLNRRHAAGLISAAQHAEWSKMYQFYVPLRGSAEREDGDVVTARVGRGFDIRGKESKSAFGRMSLADHPLAQATLMAQEGLVRVEKNRIGKTLMRLVQQYPNDDLWRVVGKLPMRKYLDDNGQVREMPDTSLLREDRVLAVKVGGKQQYVELVDPVLAHAAKNLGLQKVGEVGTFINRLTTVLRGITRTFSRLQTAANPNFVLPNVQSDYLEGVMTAYAVKDKKGLTRRFMLNHPKAFLAAARREAGFSAGAKWDAIVDEWVEAGGKMDFMAFRDLDEISDEIGRMVDPKGKWRTWTAPFDALNETIKFIEKVNQPFESAARLAMYQAARESGVSKAKAAAMALDVSGNYTRRGTWTPALSAGYAFINPAIKGIEKFGRLGRNPKILAAYLMTPVLSYTLAMLSSAAFPDDDDPEDLPLYFKITPWERSRSIIFPTSRETDANGVDRLVFTPFRVPHNLRPLWSLGDQIAAVQFGAATESQAASQVAAAMVQNFNPMGGDTVVSSIAPTAVDPFVEIMLNRTWTGVPIRPPDYPWTEGVPNSSNYFIGRTNPFALSLAQGLNRATGGSSVEKGLIDIYPNEMEYMLNYAAGGLGAFFMQTIESARNAYDGVETPPGRVPIVRMFKGKTDWRAEQRLFYDTYDQLQGAQNRLRNAKKIYESSPNPDPADWDAIAEMALELGAVVEEGKNIDWMNSVVKPHQKTADATREMRKEITALQGADMPRAERERQMRLIEGEMEILMRQARADYADMQMARGLP